MNGRDDRWGYCAAFGCPLFGAVKGGSDQWVCFCHYDRTGGVNDAITAALNSDALRPIVAATIDIRQYLGTDDWELVHQGINQALHKAGRRDLMLSLADASPHAPNVPVVKIWLSRLERVLIDETREKGKQQKIPSAPVVGADYAEPHYSEVE